MMLEKNIQKGPERGFVGGSARSIFGTHIQHIQSVPPVIVPETTDQTHEPS
jgi:hypothetical protein